MNDSPRLSKLLEELDIPPPKYLYHYSSLSGLLGILNSRSIWASVVSSLNDKNEIVHANDVLEHALENKFFSMGIKDNHWFHTIALQIRSIQATVGQCVASLCEENDQLSLWRPYAGDGMGASIGFTTDSLSKIALNQGFELKKVIYNQHSQYAICKAYLDDLFEQHNIDGKIESLPKGIMDDMREFVNSKGIFLKHPSFEDEREWRLISKNVHLYDKSWKYRASVDMIVPYLTLDLSEIFERGSNFLKKENVGQQAVRITLGPRVKTPPTSSALKAITRAITGTAFDITLSGSPYQG